MPQALPTHSLTLLSIPHTILTRILTTLSYKDIVAFSGVSKECRQLYLCNDDLKLVVQSARSGVAEVICDRTSWPSGLLSRYLKMRDNDWTQYKVRDIWSHIRARGLPTPQLYWHLCRQEEGVLIAGSRSNQSPENNPLLKQTCQSVEVLEIDGINPNVDMQEQVWRVINVHEDVIEVGLAIRESDLVVVLTILPLKDTGHCASGEPLSLGFAQIKAHLRQFSTGDAHPAATSPVLDICRVISDRCKLKYKVEISGPLLFVAYAHDFPDHTGDMHLVVFNWMTGARFLERIYPDGDVFALLLPNLFVITNRKSGILSFYEFSQNTGWTIKPLNSLGLPQLVESTEFQKIDVKRSHRHSVYAGNPIHNDRGWPFIRFTPGQEIVSFIIYVYSSKWIDARSRLYPLRAESWEFDHEQFLLTVNLNTLIRLAYQTHFQDGHGRTPGASGNQFPQTIDWKRWGPMNTHFEAVGETPDDWTYYVSNFGQRQIISLTAHATIRDYNPLTLQEYHNDKRKLSEGRLESTAKLHWEVHVCRNPLFMETVRTMLPYVEIEMVLSEWELLSPSSMMWLEQDYMIYGEDLGDYGTNFEVRSFHPDLS